MNAGSQADPSFSQRPRLTTVCGLFALIMLVTAAALAVYGNQNHGMPGLWTAIVVVAICTICGVAALVVAGKTAGSQTAVNGLLFGVMLRTMVPLVAAVFLQNQVPYFAAVGVLGMMVPAYLVALVSETLLSLWLTGFFRSVAKAA